MTSKRVLTPEQLLLIHAEHRSKIERALADLIAQAARGSEATGWHKVVADLFDEAQIGWMAEEYQEFIRPPTPPAPKNSTIKALRSCEQQARQLWMTLEMLRGDGWSELRKSFEALNVGKKPVVLSNMGEVLASLGHAAAVARTSVQKRSPRKGALPDKRPFEVARIAARQYHRITLDKPGRIFEIDAGKSAMRGAFTDFLDEIYRALGITASVDAGARDAAKWWKEERNQASISQDLAAKNRDNE